MSRIHVAVLLALSLLALPASTAFAQVIFGPGMEGASPRSNPGGVLERNDVQTCQATGGGTRTKSNCEVEATTVPMEDFRLPIEARALPNTQCVATATIDYEQRNTVARVDSTLEIAHCTAASGTFTVALRLRDENGENKPLEFSQAWQRSDDQDVKFTADYSIGENVELLGARLRALRCTCAEPAKQE
jgi:hypothetical protein